MREIIEISKATNDIMAEASSHPDECQCATCSIGMVLAEKISQAIKK